MKSSRLAAAEIYNYFRDYDPGIGRYVESDRIGLKAGLNTYAYVGSNPLAHVDSKGLFVGSGNGGEPGKCYYLRHVELYVKKGPLFGWPEWVTVTCYYYCPPGNGDSCPAYPAMYERRKTFEDVLRIVPGFNLCPPVLSEDQL